MIYVLYFAVAALFVVPIGRFLLNDLNDLGGPEDSDAVELSVIATFAVLVASMWPVVILAWLVTKAIRPTKPNQKDNPTQERKCSS